MTTPRLNAERILKALHAAFCHDADRTQLLQLTATRLRQAGAPYDGVYVYVLEGDKLTLAAHDGAPTDLHEMAANDGLSGEAASRTMIRRGDEILGRIDVNSSGINGLNAVEQAAVQRVADGLASLL